MQASRPHPQDAPVPKEIGLEPHVDEVASLHVPATAESQGVTREDAGEAHDRCPADRTLVVGRGARHEPGSAGGPPRDAPAADGVAPLDERMSADPGGATGGRRAAVR